MKAYLIVAAITASVAGSALAESAEPIAPVAEIADWSGLYFGAIGSMDNATRHNSVYHTQGSLTDSKSEKPVSLAGSMVGTFAGYNVQHESLVYGFEAAYSGGLIGYSGETGEGLNNVIDLKARGGIAAGDALFYGFAGWSIGEHHGPDIFATVKETITAAGINYGVGVNFYVTNNVFFGAEYIIRNLSREVGRNCTSDLESVYVFELDTEAVQFRVGMNF